MKSGDMIRYLSSIGCLVWWYVSRLVFPDGITIMHAYLCLKGAMVVLWIMIIAGMLGASAWLFGISRQRPWRRLGLTWLMIGCLPVVIGAAITPAQGVLIEPHWFIFASIGFFIMLADSVAANKKAYILATVLLVIWTVTSWRYNEVWSSEPWYCAVWHMYNPEYKASAFFLANAEMEKGHYTQARYYYRQSIMQRRKDWIVYTSLGHVDALEHKYEAARNNFRHALAIEPQGLEAWLQLAMIDEQEGNIAEAEKSLNRAYNINPHDSRVVRHLGDVYSRQGRYEQANVIFLKADALVPCAEKTMLLWMRMGASSHDQETTLKAARRAGACSASPMVLTMAGSIYGHYHYYEKAETLFNKALAINPDFKDARQESAKWKARQRQ